MGDTINQRNDENHDMVRQEADLIKISENLLLDTKTDIAKCTSLSIPIAQLSTLGAGVSSLIPALRTVTQTTTISAQGLYQLANAGVGDVLKVAKNGNFWGAMKTADGASKMAQLQAAGSITETTKAIAAISPATMMMAVALFSIEQELGNIAEMEKQIISFLEIEKEAEIEADVKTLSNITVQYKYTWDNERFVASNHKLVLDIQRTARKNMIAFQKKVAEALDTKNLIVAQNMVNTTLSDLLKKFKYYRLSLFTFSMASLLEIMLSGNFKEEYTSGIKDVIETYAIAYRDLYGKSSEYIEKLSHASVETNLLKGIGLASDAVGKFIGKIPLVEKGSVDEFLQDSGAHLKKSATSMERSAVGAFAGISNPGTRIFVDKINNMVQIYNHTEGIYFDDKMIYLVSG
jgi:hypothetical protein